MTTKATIQNIVDSTNSKNGVEFKVSYINTTDGKSFTCYPDTTHGYNLLQVGRELMFHYRTNTSNGKIYYNCYNITEAVQIQPSQQIINLLTNINDLLETLVQKQPSPYNPPVKQSPQTDDGLPF